MIKITALTLPIIIAVLAMVWLIIRGLYRDRQPPQPIMSPGQWQAFMEFNSGTLQQYESYGPGGCVVERRFLGRIK